MSKKEDRLGYEFTNKNGDHMKITEYTSANNFYAVKTTTGERFHGRSWKNQVEDGTLGCGKSKKNIVAAKAISAPSLEEAWQNSTEEEKKLFIKNRFNSIPLPQFEYYLTRSDGTDHVLFTIGIENLRQAKKLKRHIKVRQIDESEK